MIEFTSLIVGSPEMKPMSIGARVRGLFGPYERPVAEAYRSIYIDLDDWARQLHSWAPDALNILEVGCGEGAMSERLLTTFPKAHVTAIDIMPRVGRLFSGDASRVTFKQMPVGDVAATMPGNFDLVIMCDVLHHVPHALRKELLVDIGRTVKPGGLFAMKDWARSATPIHWMCYASDRYLTGDDVHYGSPVELSGLLGESFGADKVKIAPHVRPWRNNISFQVQL
jgi:SAM-dependent methyltransferase